MGTSELINCSCFALFWILKSIISNLNMNSEPIEVNEIDGILAYVQSINWNEPWLQGVLCLHGFIGSITIFTRKCTSVQIFLFLSYLCVIYLGELINEKAASNWRLFASQQYFDSNGLFISVILLGPLLLNCVLMVIFWLLESCEILVKVKRAEYRQKCKDVNQSSKELDDQSQGCDKSKTE